MQIKSFLPVICGVGLLAALPLHAQKMEAFLRAVGGMSAQQARTQALTQAQIASHVSPGVPRSYSQLAQLPTGTLLTSSVSQAFTSFARVPSRVKVIEFPEFSTLNFRAVLIPENTYIMSSHILLPKGSYVLEMPNGDYHFATPQHPFTTAVTQQLSEVPSPVLLQEPAQTHKSVPADEPNIQSGWTGKQQYLDPQELAQDVVRLGQPFTRYAKTPLGPVRGYEVPEGVVYLTTLSTKITLQAKGIYAVLYQESTKTAQFINKQAYPFLRSTL